MSRNNLKQGRSEQLLRLLMSDIAASCGVGAGSGAVIALERKETVERGIQEVYYNILTPPGHIAMQENSTVATHKGSRHLGIATINVEIDHYTQRDTPTKYR